MYRLLSEGSKTVTDVGSLMSKRPREQSLKLLMSWLRLQMNYFWSFLNGICSCLRRGGLKRGED